MSLLKEIITCKNHEKTTVSTNGRLNIFDKKATLKCFPMTVQFNQNYRETIISLKEVADIPGVRITTDTNQERGMTFNLRMEMFLSSRSANLSSIFTTQKRKMTRQKKTITLITMPLLIILVFRPSRKIKTS